MIVVTFVQFYSKVCFSLLPVISKLFESQSQKVLTLNSGYSQLTRWCRGSTSALGAKGPGFNSRIRQRFFMFDLLFLLCFYFFVQKHKICHRNTQTQNWFLPRNRNTRNTLRSFYCLITITLCCVLHCLLNYVIIMTLRFYFLPIYLK